ncbi:hypothetical protein [Mangrovimonas xylaniphaga]|uniref:hypothetical protein n=1 Tax=Mangrovimonas xylaniphaga TaxID=1645915 RepID=UPI0006B5814C|nr:hypothetical protein [Mangrovimonas xylaniphaga]
MKYVISVILVLVCLKGYSQIPETLYDEAKKLESHYATKIDSIKNLSNNCKITYSSDSKFKCIHLKLKNDSIIPLDIRLKNNYQGFVAFKSDFDNYILINERGAGSGNPTYIVKIDKNNGRRENYGEEQIDY